MVAIFGLVSFLVVSLTVLPVLVLLLTAFRPQGKLWLDPAGFSLENFVNLASQPGLGQLISNTVIYVGGTIAIAVLRHAMGVDHRRARISAARSRCGC